MINLSHYTGHCGFRVYTILVYTSLSLILLTSGSPPVLDSINMSHLDGRKVFRVLKASRCGENCVTAEYLRGHNNGSYCSRGRPLRVKRCVVKNIRVKHKGHCPGGFLETNCGPYIPAEVKTGQDEYDMLVSLAGVIFAILLVPTAPYEALYRN